MKVKLCHIQDQKGELALVEENERCQEEEMRHWLVAQLVGRIGGLS